MRTPEEILKLVCSHLDETGTEYAIVGGFVVMYFGRPRATADIDIVLSMKDADIGVFTDFLMNNGFFASEEDMRLAFSEGSHCTVEDRETLFRLDIVKASIEMDMRVLEHKVEVDLDGVILYMASAEDTIINKLLFDREMDFQDALSIHVRQSGKLDLDYLEENCERLGCRKRWEKVKKMSEVQEEQHVT